MTKIEEPAEGGRSRGPITRGGVYTTAGQAEPLAGRITAASGGLRIERNTLNPAGRDETVQVAGSSGHVIADNNLVDDDRADVAAASLTRAAERMSALGHQLAAGGVRLRAASRRAAAVTDNGCGVVGPEALAVWPRYLAYAASAECDDPELFLSAALLATGPQSAEARLMDAHAAAGAR